MHIACSDASGNLRLSVKRPDHEILLGFGRVHSSSSDSAMRHGLPLSLQQSGTSGSLSSTRKLLSRNMKQAAKPLHVVIWRESWLPRSETFIRNQQHALELHGTKVTTLGLGREDSPLASDGDKILFPGRYIGRLRRVLVRRGWGVRKLRRELRSLNPDIILAHFATDAATVSGAARELGIPVVTVLHGYDVTRNHAPNVLRRVQRGLGEANALVAVSAFVKANAVALGGRPDRIHVLPIGIPTPHASPIRHQERSEQHACRDSDVVFVGRLTAKKGVNDLLDAIAALNASDVHPRVRIIGDGDMRSELENRANAMESEIAFLGAMSPEGVRRELGCARLFVAPSKTAPDGDSEGFGMVFLEAALAGLPVVSYRHGGVPEAVADGRSGALVEEGDVQGLAETIKALLENEAGLREMGDFGRERVVREFNVVDRTRALLALLRTEAMMGARPEER